MLAIISLIGFLLVHIGAFEIDPPRPEDLHGKTYPGFAVFDHDGQYLRFIGPLYMKVAIPHFKLPLQLWKPINISIAVTPTVELFSVYMSAAVMFEGSTLYQSDGDADQCVEANLHCPILPGSPLKRIAAVTPGNLGLFPGWYEGYFEIMTTDEHHKKYRLGGLKFKVKFSDE